MGLIVGQLQTNFNGGLASPFIEGRPDVGKYFNMLRQADNILLLPEGGFTKRAGTRFLKSTKSDGVAVFIPFLPSLESAYMLEFGNLYIRIHRRDGTQAAEVVSPYTTADLDHIAGGAGLRQSVDVLFIDHPDYAPRKLSRIGDTTWTLSLLPLDPPPSFEADTDISGGTATLTPAAITGTGINFTASSGVFLVGDVGRQIIFGVSRAVITAFTSTTVVVCDILDDFPNTDPIAAGSWLLRLSPQSWLDPDKKEPVGAQVVLIARISAGGGGQNTFRAADIGKFIKVYSGLIKVTQFINATELRGTILSTLSDATAANPADAPPGSWSLQVPMWSATRGWPANNEFHEQRLFHSGSDGDPTTIVGSQSNNYENYGVGSLATDAVQYAHASGEFDKINWLASQQNLFFGTGRREVKMRGSGTDEPLGGDVVPDVKDQTAKGSAAIRPAVISDSMMFVNRGLTKVHAMRFSIEIDKFRAFNLNTLSRTITEHDDPTLDQGLKQHHIAYAQEPYSTAYFIRNDGKLLALTYDDEQEILGWTILNLDDKVLSVSVLPHEAGKIFDDVWVIVERTINGATKRYIEIFENTGHSATQAKWTQYNSDCAIKITKSTTTEQTTITGLTHLAAETVDLWMYRTDLGTAQSPSYLGQFVVSAAGVLTLTNPVDFTCIFEIGIPYRPVVQTMRPAIPDRMLEGHTRKWIKMFLRLYKSIPPRVSSEQADIHVGGEAMDQGPQLVTGDVIYEVAEDWDYDLDGYLTIDQEVPGPLTVVSLFGECEFSERM